MPSNTNVLAVDDNRVQSYAIERKLRSVGFHVKSVHRGSDALAEMHSGQYDAILLDVNLPDMSGFDVCSRVRSAAGKPQPAIVFHSATHASELVFRQAMALGGDAFLTYPIETSALTAVLLRSVAMRRGAVGPPMLTCWKDIAQFFGKGVRTVQRWEAELGMPVRRPRDSTNVVFADPEELRAWAHQNRGVIRLDASANGSSGA